jgi:hypothetical protein
MKKTFYLLCAALTILLTACGPQPTPQPASPTRAIFQPNINPDQNNQAGAMPTVGYPVAGAALPTSYPVPGENVPTQIGYPAQPTSAIRTPGAADIVPIKLNKPLLEGTTEVTGTGLKDLPLVLMDMTMNGDYLAETTVQPDGKFTFKVKALEKGHRLGIALGNTKGTRWENYDFGAVGFQGTEPMLVPNIGYFFDTVYVDPKK